MNLANYAFKNGFQLCLKSGFYNSKKCASLVSPHCCFNATSLIESGVFKPTKDLLNMLIV